MSACEVLSLYSEINTRCIENGIAIGKPKSHLFVELTRIMLEAKDILTGFKIRLTSNFPSLEREIIVSFWSLYSQDDVLEVHIISALYEMKGLPRIVITDDTLKNLQKFLLLSMEFE